MASAHNIFRHVKIELASPLVWLSIYWRQMLLLLCSMHSRSDFRTAICTTKIPSSCALRLREEASEWQSTIAKAIKDTSKELKKLDTGLVLEDMNAKAQEIEHEEGHTPRVDSLQRTGSVSSLQVQPLEFDDC